MPYNYLVPRISPLYPGYSCTGFVNAEALSQRLRDGTGVLDHVIRVYRESTVVHEARQTLEFRDGEPLNEISERFHWSAAGADWGEVPGFLEEDIRTADGSLRFVTKYNRPAYVMNWAPGRKTYLINLSPKFADQRVIEQIATFGRFIDTCSTVWIDRERDYGHSFILVNPFTKPIVARFQSEDGRVLRGNRVPAQSARIVRSDRLLAPDEKSWRGQVQITASNRLLVADCKHALSDPGQVTDMEHLDPYRTDPTHFPAFQWLRQRIGRALADRGINLDAGSR